MRHRDLLPGRTHLVFACHRCGSRFEVDVLTLYADELLDPWRVVHERHRYVIDRKDGGTEATREAA